jgi:uncharacterized protein YjcR
LSAEIWPENEVEELIKECEANEIALANRGWSLLQIIKQYRDQIAGLQRLLEITQENVEFAMSEREKFKNALMARGEYIE